MNPVAAGLAAPEPKLAMLSTRPVGPIEVIDQGQQSKRCGSDRQRGWCVDVAHAAAMVMFEPFMVLADLVVLRGVTCDGRPSHRAVPG